MILSTAPECRGTPSADLESFLLSFLGPSPPLNRVGLWLLGYQEGLEAAWGDVKKGYGGSWFFILVPKTMGSGTEVFVSEPSHREGAPPHLSRLSLGCKMRNHQTIAFSMVTPLPAESCV